MKNKLPTNVLIFIGLVAIVGLGVFLPTSQSTKDQMKVKNK